MIKQKGMNFDHNFCYLFILLSSSLFFKEGREKGKIITSRSQSHAFLLNPFICTNVCSSNFHLDSGEYPFYLFTIIEKIVDLTNKVKEV